MIILLRCGFERFLKFILKWPFETAGNELWKTAYPNQTKDWNKFLLCLSPAVRSVYFIENNDSLSLKTSLKKMVSTLNDSFCLIYELFIFHDKNSISKDVTKEFFDKIQKIANLHYNTFLNKSFKKNKLTNSYDLLVVF